MRAPIHFSRPLRAKLQDLAAAFTRYRKVATRFYGAAAPEADRISFERQQLFQTLINIAWEVNEAAKGKPKRTAAPRAAKANPKRH